MAAEGSKYAASQKADVEVFNMKGGDGQYSYAKHSNKQKKVIDNTKSMLIRAIDEHLDMFPVTNSFRIVDLGCSIGPNTFVAVQNIIQGITNKYEMEGQSCYPEFHVCFNDHVSNDFNALFASLPQEKQYFVAAAPGSFHKRLFPKASIDFFYSTCALHWLSKAPQELSDTNSLACNKGRIFYANAPKEVGEAYAAQYAKDMESFLAARAQEVVPGGLMVILIPGRPDGTLLGQSPLGASFILPLESSLVDMANEGIINDAKLTTFNLPLYNPSLEEFRMLVQQNGCFSIETLDSFEPQSYSSVTSGECRAGFEDMITKHFGCEVIEPLFERYATKLAELPPIDARDVTNTLLFVVLKRNH